MPRMSFRVSRICADKIGQGNLTFKVAVQNLDSGEVVGSRLVLASAPVSRAAV